MIRQTNELKNFENLLEEYRVAQFSELVKTRESLDVQYVEMQSLIDDMKFTHTQTRT